MKRIFLPFLFLAFAAVSLHAQPLSKSTYENMILAAEQSLADKNYYVALDWYEQAYDEKEDKALLPIIADLNYEIRDYKQAARKYKQLLRRDKENKYIQYRYQYGRVLKMSGNHEEAIEELQTYLNVAPNDSMRTLAKNEITGAELALELPEIAKGLNLENAGKNINSSFSEYSPAFSPDGELYYVNFKTDTETAIEIDEEADDYHARIVKSNKEETGKGRRKKVSWSKPKALSTKINRPEVHKTHISLSADGETMFYTQADISGNVIDNCKIYYSKGGGSWEAGQEVKGVNGDYVAKHPTAGELYGNEVLFFSSNMPGGYGGFDLYYATKTAEGEYDTPVNLGATINTPGNEETPHYRDGTLYFSTDGHPTLGGFDNMYASWDGSNWSEPSNMGWIYNSEVDDQYFTLDAEGYKGFLVSNRPTRGAKSNRSKTCCFDIYEFEIARIFADLVVGVFSEEKKPIKGATVDLVDLNSKAIDSKSNDRGNRYDYGLNLETPYKVVVSAEGYYPDSIEVATVGLKESQTFSHNFFLRPIPPPPPPVEEIIVVDEPYVLENILYDFDDDRITKASEEDLQFILDLMNKHADMKIELASHTDFRGEAPYNENLSQRRANSARRWLIKREIDGDRIVAKGYGESKAQTVSEKVAAKHDFLNEGDVLTEEFIKAMETEEQREIANAINRRTEFTITEGPTSVRVTKKVPIKETEKKGKDRKALPVQPQPDTLKISYLSSLYGKKTLKGVPVMDFQNRVIDFGTMKKGAKKEHKFEFVNRGDTTLEIGVVTACECTETDYSSRTVKPGEKGYIHVIFDSTEKEEMEDTIDVDIMLDNVDPESGNPIMEAVQFKYKLKK